MSRRRKAEVDVLTDRGAEADRALGEGQGAEGGDRPDAVARVPGPFPFDETRTAPPVRGRRVERLRERRRRRATIVVAALVIVGSVSAGVIALLPGAKPPPPRVAPPVGGAVPPSLAWAVQWGGTASVALVGVPAGKPAAAVAVPDDMFVDLPSGAPNHVGEASVTGPAALESVQTVFGRRVGHYLSSTPEQIGALVDRLGGVRVQTETQFSNGGAQVGPGPLTMNASMAVAYLTTAEGVDPWVRWEDVLAGILEAKAKPSAWSTPPGTADDASAVTSLLQQAQGATVVEIQTAPSVQGGVEPDPTALSTLIASRVGPALGPLVRVIVENGNGRPGLGAVVGELLAPRGFLVVASQNASSFDVQETQVVAANASFLPWANEAQGLLGAGKVYQGSQATGVADVTIVVGKDFTAG